MKVSGDDSVGATNVVLVQAVLARECCTYKSSALSIQHVHKTSAHYNTSTSILTSYKKTFLLPLNQEQRLLNQ